LGHYFFENKNAVTVNGIRYREMISNILRHETNIVFYTISTPCSIFS